MLTPLRGHQAPPVDPAGLRGVGIAAALLASFLVAAVFAGPIGSGERFYFRDLSQNHGPVFEGARHLWGEGQPPFWNPWSGGGEPLAANPNALLFHPFGLLALVFPGSAGLAVAIVSSLLLASFFLALLLRDLGRSTPAALLGGAAFALGGVALSLGTLPNLIAAACWVPAALYALRRAVRSPRAIAPAALAVACVLLPADPAAAAVLAAFAPGIVAARGREGTRETDPAGGGEPLLRRALAPVLLGAAVAAVQWLPGLLWIAASDRAAGVAADARRWSLALGRLPEVIAPGFLGDPSGFAWWSAGLFETGFPLLLSLHVGAPVMGLAVVGAAGGVRAIRRGDRQGALVPVSCAAIGTLFAVAATGAGVGLLSWLPGGGLFRYAEKFSLGVALALAVLAAEGADRLLSQSPDARRTGIIASGVMACLLAAGALAVSPARMGSWFEMPAALTPLRDAAAVGARASLLAGASAAAALALLAAAMKRLGTVLRPALLVGLALAALLAGGVLPGAGAVPWRIRANPSAPPEVLSGEPIFADRLAALRLSGERLYRQERPPGFAVRTRTGTVADGFAWDAKSLSRSSASGFGIELAFDRSTDRVDPRGSAAAARFLATLAPELQARFWSLACVRLVIAYEPLDAPGLVLVDRLVGETNRPVLLYENRRTLPRARVVARARRVSSDEEAFRALAEADEGSWASEVRIQDAKQADGVIAEEVAAPADRLEALRDTGLRLAHRGPSQGLDGTGPGIPAVGAGAGAGGGGAEILERGAGWLRVRVNGAAVHTEEDKRFLVVSENLVPGWQARLDGRPALLLRADGAHIAVPLPDAGPHEVLLRYFPPGLLAGAILTALGLISSLAWTVLAARRRRAAAAPAGAATLEVA